MRRNSERNKQIEEALKFLVFAIQESGNNPKPVILHSVRIGLHLDSLGYDKKLVIAAMLHDVIEDTDTEIEDVRSKFGNRIAELVEAASFDFSIEDKTERYKENFKRCFKAGKPALIIRAADFFDNIDYYHLASTRELTGWLLGKLEYFIENSKDILKDEAIYQELADKYQTTIIKLKS